MFICFFFWPMFVLCMVVRGLMCFSCFVFLDE